jgi:hypothetical protein
MTSGGVVLGLFWTLVAIVEALLVATFRSGLQTSPLLLVACAGLLASGASMPALVNTLTPRLVQRMPYLGPLASLAILASPLLAFWFGIAIGFALIVLGITALVFGLTRLRSASQGKLGWMLALVPVTSWYLFVSVNNQGLANIYSLEQSYLGLLNRDTSFHTAIAHMIQNFGVASLGMDGLLPIAYHTGSHWWFAALGLATGNEPLIVYPAGIVVVAVPALVMAVSFAAYAISRGTLTAAGVLIRVLLLLLAVDAVSHNWTSYYISESYTLGLVAMLLLLPMLMNVVDHPHPDRVQVFLRPALLVAAIVLLSALKVSVGLLWAVAVCWVVLRSSAGWMTRAAQIAAAAASVLLALRLFSPGTADYLPKTQALVVPLYFFRLFPLSESLSSFLVPACFLTLVAGSLWWRNRLWSNLRERKMLYAEVVLVVTVVGALPALLGVPQDSAVWYFLNVGQWYALPALAAALERADLVSLTTALTATRAGWVALAFCGYVAVTQAVMAFDAHFLSTAGNIVRALDARSNGRLLQGTSAGAWFRASLRDEGRLFGSRFRLAFVDSPGARLARIVRARVAGQPRFGVFVPPDNQEFWKLVPGCRTIYHVQPSISGRPSILGAPPKAMGCERDAYQENYGPDVRSRELDDAALCGYTNRRDVDTVLILHELSDGPANRILRCKGA